MEAMHVPAGAVVVGIDGSPSSDQALTWAAEEAALEGRALVVAHAAPPPSATGSAWLMSVGVDHHQIIEQLRAESRALLDRVTERVAAAYPGLEIHPAIRLADPREALLELAHDAHLLVVGSRGLGPVRSLLLGSVSLALAKHSPVPVVVTRHLDETRTPGGVLVAVSEDGTDRRALEIAFEVADARGMPLTALHCFWDMNKISQGAVDVPDDEPGLDDERARLRDAVRHLEEQYPDVPVHLQLTRGFVDARLIRASEHADLIVLGHQPKPLINEFVYGSVAPEVVEHAKCSVAIVTQPKAMS
ncbi:MAG: universal stress protein [Nocardioides sp.]